MGLFDRFRRVLRANANEVLRRAEDPEKMLNQLLVEMHEQLLESKRSVANAIADQKRLERQLQTQQEAANEWERRAMVALRAGNEQLAREALTRKQREDAYTDQLRQQVEKQRLAVDDLKAALRTLQDKIEEAQRKKNLLVARAKRAEAQKRIQEVLTGISDTSAFDAFEEMAARVDQIEAQTEAMAELAPTREDTSLEAQFAALERGGTDALLDDLRRRMELESSSQSSGADGVDASLEELKRRMREAGTDTP